MLPENEKKSNIFMKVVLSVFTFVLITAAVLVYLLIKENKQTKQFNTSEITTSTLRPIESNENGLVNGIDPVQFTSGKKANYYETFKEIELRGIVEKVSNEGEITIVVLGLNNDGEQIEIDFGFNEKMIGKSFMNSGFIPVPLTWSLDKVENITENINVGESMIVYLLASSPSGIDKSTPCNDQCQQQIQDYEKYKDVNEQLFSDAELNKVSSVKRVGVVSQIILNK